MALIDDDKIKGLDGDGWVVADHHWFLHQRGVRFKERALFVFLVEFLVGQHRIEALDGRDADLGTRADRLALEVLNLIFLGELVAGAGARELLKLVERLATKIVAVNKKQDSFCTRMLDEPVAGVDGGVGLARTGGHLNQGTGAIFSQAFLQVRDAPDLNPPQVAGVERGHLPQQCPQLLILGGEPDQFLGAVEGEDFPTSSVWFEGVGEAGHFTCGLVGERQGEPVVRKILRQATFVFAGLGLDTRQRIALRLGFHDADSLAVGIEHVVGVAGFERELTDGDPDPFAKIDGVGILNDPTSIPKVLVDQDSGLLFWGERHHASCLLNPTSWPD